MKISVVIPCLNEERTIGICVDKAKIGIKSADADGEILVVDNGSTDTTALVAKKHGATVVHASKRGYGNAIREGIDCAIGTYVVIGDGDDSYDFTVIPDFINKLEEENCDLVVGNRFKGGIKPGAMPFLNRYFGNPLISTFGKLLYGKVCNDFYCGLRAARREALTPLHFSRSGMDFAIEMIIKAATLELKIGEVPIMLHPDGRNRPPHLRRWRDGFKTIVYMMQYKFILEKRFKFKSRE